MSEWNPQTFLKAIRKAQNQQARIQAEKMGHYMSDLEPDDFFAPEPKVIPKRQKVEHPYDALITKLEEREKGVRFAERHMGSFRTPAEVVHVASEATEPTKPTVRWFNDVLAPLSLIAGFVTLGAVLFGLFVLGWRLVSP